MPDIRTQPKLLGSLSVAENSISPGDPTYGGSNAVIVNSRRDLYLHVKVKVSGSGTATETVAITGYAAVPDAIAPDAAWGTNGTLTIAYNGPVQATYERMYTVLAAGRDMGFFVSGTGAGGVLAADVFVDITVLGSSNV